jgi:catechol 2,3-dioxygenase-like lactoylglutathione lyase family enzyme
MGVQGFDHVGAVVDDLEAATAFFLDLGLEREGGGPIEGEWMDKVIGLDQVRAELVIVRTPDGSGKLELTKFHTPSDEKGACPSPANQLGIRISPSSSMTSTRSSTDCAPTALA